jgi:hypothetical protein
MYTMKDLSPYVPKIMRYKAGKLYIAGLFMPPKLNMPSIKYRPPKKTTCS